MSSVRERHVRYAADPTIMRTDDDPEWCADCDVPWPCDAIQMADDADRLAAWIPFLLSVIASGEQLSRSEEAAVRDALGQHEEATR